MVDSKSTVGKVALVGAGPGDPGLLTLKGRDCLASADVVIYDYLANQALLAHAPETAEFIYAGKKEGHATLEQADLNQLLIDKAREGKTVVRLKGGDPFIFGRGGEEAIALKEAGIPFIVVPGVSSPTAVSAYAGIPLTHRDCSSTYSVITGSNEKGKEDLHIDWEKIASRSGTLVFLMGARKLAHITNKLMEFGKDPETPIAVIQWGTTYRQKTWTGTLNTIVDIAAREKIKPPALTIVGEVVNLKPHMDWFEQQPLFGKTIVTTRAKKQSTSFTQLLLERGAEPFSFPVIQTIPVEDNGPLDKGIETLENYDGILFTSVNGVIFFLKRLKARDKDIRELKGLRIYCIGPKTAEAVEDLGIRTDVVPEEFVAESLIDHFKNEGVQGKRFILPRAEVAREILPEALRELGAEIDVLPAYRTVVPDTDNSDLIERLKAGTISAITFTSSSTVTHFIQCLGEEHLPLIQGVAIACIGPVTAKTAEDAGLKVAVQAETFTVKGLVDALEVHFSKK